MSEPKNLVKEIDAQCDNVIAHAKKKYPDRLYMFDLQKSYWGAINNAHEQGKKVVLLSANGPTELVYALDAVPFVMDTIPTRLASQPEVASRYIDLAEKYVPNTFCGINKIDLGYLLSGDLMDKPDAMVYGAAPCDSARSCFPAIDQMLGVPSYCIDTPYKKDDKGFKYVADQLREVVTLLEKVTGNKLDWDKLVEINKKSNEATVLLAKIADLKKNVPCPIPGRFLVLNELYSAMLGSQAMVDFLEAEYQMGKAALDKGLGCTAGPEKFRFIWLQNMLWSNVGIMDWMEKEYGATVIMDGFGFKEGVQIENPWDQDEMFMGLAKRMYAVPMVHGATGPVEPWMELVDNTIKDFKINASMFVGHVGCKHTWAASKLIKDMVQDKYGISTLTFDVDALDSRYKSTEEIRAVISEYIDTLIQAKNAKTA